MGMTNRVVLRRALAVVVLSGALYPALAVAASAWDSFVNSATSSVLDSAKSTVNGALQGGQQPPSSPPSAPQSSSTSGPQQSRTPSQSGTTPASHAAGAHCLQFAPVDAKQQQDGWVAVTNGCDFRVTMIRHFKKTKNPDDPQCYRDNISPKGRWFGKATYLQTFDVACQWTPPTGDKSCDCPGAPVSMPG